MWVRVFQTQGAAGRGLRQSGRARRPVCKGSGAGVMEEGRGRGRWSVRRALSLPFSPDPPPTSCQFCLFTTHLLPPSFRAVEYSVGSLRGLLPWGGLGWWLIAWTLPSGCSGSVAEHRGLGPLPGFSSTWASVALLTDSHF